MLQLHFPHGDTEAFRQFVAKAATRVSGNPDATVLFHLFNNTAQRQVTDNAVAIVHDIMPKALVVGCSTFGNICDGRFVDAGTPLSVRGLQRFRRSRHISGSPSVSA